MCFFSPYIKDNTGDNISILFEHRVTAGTVWILMYSFSSLSAYSVPQLHKMLLSSTNRSVDLEFLSLFRGEVMLQSTWKTMHLNGNFLVLATLSDRYAAWFTPSPNYIAWIFELVLEFNAPSGTRIKWKSNSITSISSTLPSPNSTLFSILVSA